MLPLPEAGNNKNGKKFGYLFQNEVVSVSTSLHTDFQKDRVRTKDRQQDEKRSSQERGRKMLLKNQVLIFAVVFIARWFQAAIRWCTADTIQDAVITTKRLKPLDWWGPWNFTFHCGQAFLGGFFVTRNKKYIEILYGIFQTT